MIIIIIVIIKIMMINKKPKSLRRIELGLFFVVEFSSLFTYDPVPIFVFAFFG